VIAGAVAASRKVRDAPVATLAIAALALGCATAGVFAQDVARYEIVGDGIPAPLAPEPGDPVRGRALVVARDNANCVLCHAVPDPAIRFAGDVGPSLAGVGRRLSASQLRLRVADNLAVNRATVMPSYYKVDGLAQVATPYAGKPILSAREVEDIVAWLATLQ
jgi:sulfur-oxidizing protein SoxX